MAPFSIFEELSKVANDKQAAATDLAAFLIRSLAQEACDGVRGAQTFYRIISRARDILTDINELICVAEAEQDWDSYFGYTAQIEPLEKWLLTISQVVPEEADAAYEPLKPITLKDCYNNVSSWYNNRSICRFISKAMHGHLDIPVGALAEASPFKIPQEYDWADDLKAAANHDDLAWVSAVVDSISDSLSPFIDLINQKPRNVSDIRGAIEGLAKLHENLEMAWRVEDETIALATRCFMLMHGVITVATEADWGYDTEHEPVKHLLAPKTWKWALRLVNNLRSVVHASSKPAKDLKHEWSDYENYLLDGDHESLDEDVPVDIKPVVDNPNYRNPSQVQNHKNTRNPKSPSDDVLEKTKPPERPPLSFDGPYLSQFPKISQVKDIDGSSPSPGQNYINTGDRNSQDDDIPEDIKLVDVKRLIPYPSKIRRPYHAQALTLVKLCFDMYKPALDKDATSNQVSKFNTAVEAVIKALEFSAASVNRIEKFDLADLQAKSAAKDIIKAKVDIVVAYRELGMPGIVEKEMAHAHHRDVCLIGLLYKHITSAKARGKDVDATNCMCGEELTMKLHISDDDKKSLIYILTDPMKSGGDLDSVLWSLGSRFSKPQTPLANRPRIYVRDETNSMSIPIRRGELNFEEAVHIVRNTKNRPFTSPLTAAITKIKVTPPPEYLMTLRPQLSPLEGPKKLSKGPEKLSEGPETFLESPEEIVDSIEGLAKSVHIFGLSALYVAEQSVLCAYAFNAWAMVGERERELKSRQSYSSLEAEDEAFTQLLTFRLEKTEKLEKLYEHLAVVKRLLELCMDEEIQNFVPFHDIATAYIMAWIVIVYDEQLRSVRELAQQADPTAAFTRAIAHDALEFRRLYKNSFGNVLGPLPSFDLIYQELFKLFSQIIVLDENESSSQLEGNRYPSSRLSSVIFDRFPPLKDLNFTLLCLEP